MPDEPETPEDDGSSTPSGMLQTVDRALQILLATDREHDGWSVTEVSAEFGFSTSVAHRLLATLTHRDFLIADPSTRRYRIGPAAMTVGRIWAGSQSLRLLVQPVLAQLAEETGLAAIFAIPDAFHMRAIAAATGTEGPLRTYPLVGELFPAHAGATSKAYYAHLPDLERRRTFADRPMARFTPSTTIDPAVLEQQFERIRRQGYATSSGEYDVDVSTVAMVVRLRNEPFGSLSLGRHGEFMTDVPALVRRLEEARRDIELTLVGRSR
ncbi:IclR family transcriptional regulator [Brachybacterium vulturis]|uniref:IclR family transcriptional regulator n=1 Tax=Brachybacterium vulturis TaxID=2017484 RepID=UPI001C48C0D4|nr:IclR family transcriptional regulator [Brachybacterium vulturis]